MDDCLGDRTEQHPADAAAAAVAHDDQLRFGRGALIDVALGHHAGLIMVGTRGRSNVTSMLLGSVAHEGSAQVHAAGAGRTGEDGLKCPEAPRWASSRPARSSSW